MKCLGMRTLTTQNEQRGPSPLPSSRRHSHDPSSSAVASVIVQKYRPSSSQPTMYSGNPTSAPFLRHEKGRRSGLETEMS